MTGIQELSGDGSAALPAVQFSYGDNMHLTKVDNGQGGSVEVVYNQWYYFDDYNKDLRNDLVLFGQTECNPYDDRYRGTAWLKVTGSTVGCVYGTSSTSYLRVGRNAAAVTERVIPQNVLKAGSWYLDYVKVKATDGVTKPKWGIIDNSTSTKIMLDSVTYYPSGIGTSFKEMQGYFEIPATYNPEVTKERIECDDCLFSSTQFVIMPTYYQVASRTIHDAATNISNTVNYVYDNPTLNTTETSDALVKAYAYALSTSTTSDSYKTYMYDRILRDYRGNGMVQETNSENLATVTWFNQSDALKGRPYRTATMQRTLFDGMDTIDTSRWVKSTAGTFTAGRINNYHFDNAASLTSTTTDWNVNLTRIDASITNGQTAVASFRLKTGGTGGEIGLLSTSGKFAGVQVSPTSASWAINTGSGTVLTPITGLGTFSVDQWYTIMITPDSANGTRIRIWKQIDPSKYAENVVTGLGSSNWKFKASAKKATLYLDAYFEGRIYSEQIVNYEVIPQNDTDPDTPVEPIIEAVAGTNPPKFVRKFDLSVNWIKQIAVENRNYEGDSSFSGTRQVNEYKLEDQNGTQYGNLTRITNQQWNGTAWVNYTATKTEYWPTFTGTNFSPACLRAKPQWTVTRPAISAAAAGSWLKPSIFMMVARSTMLLPQQVN